MTAAHGNWNERDKLAGSGENGKRWRKRHLSILWFWGSHKTEISILCVCDGTHQFKVDSAFIFHESDSTGPLPYTSVHLCALSEVLEQQELEYGEVKSPYWNRVTRMRCTFIPAQNEISRNLRWCSRQPCLTLFFWGLMPTIPLFVAYAKAWPIFAYSFYWRRQWRRLPQTADLSNWCDAYCVAVHTSYATPMTSIYSILLDFVWQDVTATAF